MLSLHTRIGAAGAIHDRLELRFDARERCRQRVRLASGEEAALLLARGTVLRGGDLLAGDDGRVVQVVAAPEPTLVAHCADPALLARCAYHLGNRHARVQVGAGWLRIQDDPVLGEMLEGLGARVGPELAPFEPEAGAYGGHAHAHGAGAPLAPVPLRQRIHRPSDPAPA